MTSDASSTPAAALDPALLEEWALGYLARYASSAENLRRVLRRRVRRRLGGGEREAVAAADRQIDALLARYRESRLLDDAAYAAARVRRGLMQGRSLRRIAAGLAEKGIAPAVAAAAVASLRENAAADPDLAAACAFARRRRLGPFRAGPADSRRDRAAFARAGFERRTAEAVLACPDAAAVAALLADAGEAAG